MTSTQLISQLESVAVNPKEYQSNPNTETRQIKPLAYTKQKHHKQLSVGFAQSDDGHRVGSEVDLSDNGGTGENAMLTKMDEF